MKNLTKVIGLAPSELSFQDLVQRLKQERNRVGQALQDFRNQIVKAKPARKEAGKDISLKTFKEDMAELGVSSIEEMRELLKELRK